MPVPADDIPVADPLPPDGDLPVAVPVAAPVAPPRKEPTRRAFPASRPPAELTAKPADVDARPPKPRYFMACCAIGCLGGSAVAGIGFLIFAAVMVLGQLGGEVAESGKSELQPAFRGPRPGPIQKSRIDADHLTMTWPSPVTAVGLGGNGRYLLMHMGSQIVVFDANTASQLTPFTFPNADSSVVFAAGASRLFVYRSGKLERYNLETHELELSVPWPNRPVALAIGAESDGPLYAFVVRSSDTEAAAIDTSRLEAIHTRSYAAGMFGSGTRSGFRISGDGRMIGIAGERHLPGGALIPTDIGNILRNELRLERLANIASNGHVALSPDHQYAYTAQGVFDSFGKPMRNMTSKNFYTLPPAHGSDFFLSLETSDKGYVRSTVRLHLRDEFTPVGAFDSVVGPAGTSTEDIETIPADQRVYYWPAAGLLAVLTPIPTARLEVYSVDVERMLRDSQRDVMAFATAPPTVAVRGQTFRYRPTLWRTAVKVGLQYELVQRPEGMQIVDDQEIVWTPDAATPSEVEIDLRAKAGPRTATQRFRIFVEDP